MKKLTKDVFNYPECPKWAKYAAVDRDGRACWYELCPLIFKKDGAWVEEHDSEIEWISGEFDASDWTNSLVKRDNNKEKEKIMYRDSKGRFAKKDTQTPDFFDELVENVKDIAKVRDAEKNELPARRILEGISQINEALQELPPEKVNQVTGLIATYFRRTLSSMTTLDKLGEVLYELSTPESH